MRKILIGTIALVALVAPASASGAELIYGLTQSNALVGFASDAPGVTTASVAVTGLPAGETLVAIDFRPGGNGKLYALGSSSRLYTVDPGSGVATAVGSAGAFTLSGTSFGFDFNPVVDRVRIMSDADQNLRVNPDNGTLAFTDATLAYALADAKAGTDPAVVAAAYSNSFTGAPTTTLYALDAATDDLVAVNPPNTGTLNTLGPLGTDVTQTAGFDISPATNIAYALLTAGGSSSLYTVNLSSGAATLVAAIGGGAPLADIAVARQIPRALVLNAANELVSVDPAVPGTVLSTTPVSGLPGGETLQGIDVRPAGNELLALGGTAPNRLYRVDPSTGAATTIGSPGGFTLAPGMSFGVDVDPVADRLRVTSDARQNLRINPIDGTSTSDLFLAYAVGDPNVLNNPFVFGSAYTNSFAGATSTTLYDLDATNDVLAIQNPPNAGTLNTVGPTVVNMAGGGFDIAGQDNTGFAAIQEQGSPTSGVARVNLTTGALATPQAIGVGPVIARGLALLPPGAVTVAAASAREGTGPAIVSVSRSAFAGGFAAVLFKTADETAKAGTDYTGTTQLVAFAPGELTRTVAIPIADDTATEGDETVGLTISGAAGNPTIVTPTVKLTILDNDGVTPPPPPPTADKTAPRISLTIGSRAKVSTVLRRGLRPRIRVNEAATVVVQLRRAARIVGRTSVKLTANRTRTVIVKIARRERGKLRRARRTRITVRVIATDAAGNRAVKRKNVSVRR